MLSAYDVEGNLICLADGLAPKTDCFTCPICRQPVILRQGKRYRPHFAHKQDANVSWHHENESMEHLSLKALLYQAFSQSEDVKVEVPLDDFEQVADLLVNSHLVLEVQCSPLSSQRLKERTLAYRQHGYQVLWLLGEKLWLKERLTVLQRDFLYFSQNMGFHLWELDLDNLQLRLKYMIHEDLEGKLHYLSHSFHLPDVSLAVFRKPFERQSLSSFSVKQNPHILTYIQKQLYYGNKTWLQMQEEAYQKGDNLLAKSLDDFYPQVRPPMDEQGFLQIEADLESYYKAFAQFYKKGTDMTYQVLYPPAYLKAWCQKNNKNA